MSQYARVHSFDALKKFRASLIEFSEAANIALGEAEAEIARAANWLRHDREPYWKREQKKRYEDMLRAKSALSHKKLYKTASGARQSAIEEEKALAKAKARYEEAETKLQNIKNWLRKLEEERFLYKSQTRRLARDVETTIPKAAAMIDRSLDALDEYMRVAPVALSDSTSSAAMSRDAIDLENEQKIEQARIAGVIAERDDLLSLVPPPAERDAIPPQDHAPVWNRKQPLTLAAIDPMPEHGERVDMEDIVILHPGFEKSNRVFFARTETGAPGDSGWYIAPIGGGDENEDVGLIAVTVSALLKKRGDLRPMLDLPLGYLIVENKNGLEYAVDENGVLFEARNPATPDDGATT